MSARRLTARKAVLTVFGILSILILLSSSILPIDPNLPRSVLKASENPRDVTYNNEAAADYYILGEHHLALVYIEQALHFGHESDGNRDEILTNYGDVLFQLGRLEECLEAYQNALYLNPINERAYTHYEIAYNRYLRHMEPQPGPEGESRPEDGGEGEDDGGAEGSEEQEEDQNNKESEKGGNPQEQSGQSPSDDPEKNPEQKDSGSSEEDENKKNEEESVSGEKQAGEGSTNPQEDKSEHPIGFTNLEDYFRAINPEDTRSINKLYFPEEGDHGEHPRLP